MQKLEQCDHILGVPLPLTTFYWYTIVRVVAEFIRSCDECQKQREIKKDMANELHCIHVPSELMKQVDVDIYTLLEVDGFIYLVVLLDYFSKWSDAKALKDEQASTVAQFLYEMYCLHGCFAIQINVQGREFVNGVANEVHSMTGTRHRITSAYHPQANGLVERQNRTIKIALVKVLDENATRWPYIIEGILFARRVSRHHSTKFSPFYMMYNRDPILPNDLRYDLCSENTDSAEAFHQEMFEAVMKSANAIRKEVYEAATTNIKKTQEKQKRDYDSRHKSSFAMKVGDSVLLKNNKRNDRKGEKFSFRWIGPYIVKVLSRKGLTTLENGVILKYKYNQSQLKPYIEGMSYKDDENIDEKYDEEIIENEPNYEIGKCNRGKDVIYESTDVLGKEDEQNLDLWNFVPDEILEKNYFMLSKVR